MNGRAPHQATGGRATPLATAADGLDHCVHCGFCLPACPTYLALEDENDSPRGRLVLMRALLEGELAADDPSLAAHIDQCLGCRGCESACPSGVPYGRLLEATRATLLATRPLPRVGALVLWAFRRPAVLAVALGGARVLRSLGLGALLGRLPGRAGMALAMLHATRRRRPVAPAGGPLGAASGAASGAPSGASAGAPAGAPAAVPDRAPARVALLEGCVMRHLFAETNRATERVLGHNGYELRRAPGQVCCGALHAHAGDVEGARALARTNIAAFEGSGADAVAVNASGCGAAMKEYPHLLATDPAWSGRAARFAAMVRDVTELLAARGPVPGAPVPATVAYDAPCHLQHAQQVTAAPLRVLAAIPGLQLVPLEDSDQCCGSAGIYSLLQPATSSAVLRPKLAAILASGATMVATGNPGCIMQIGAGLQRTGSMVRVVHPVDLLDASYRDAAAG